MSRTADLAKAIADDIRYAQNDVAAGKDPSAHLAKAAAYAKELAGVPEPAVKPAAPTTDPLLEPTEPSAGGKLISKAAREDAVSIASVNAGNPPTPGAEAYAGLAAKEGFSGVEGSTKEGSGGFVIVFTVFVNGAVAAIVEGDTNTDTGALGQQYGVPA